jgi:glycosyltransferase involved in cell wall biosynthesis
MRVRIFPADQTGCGHYRLIWPGRLVDVMLSDWTVQLGEQLPTNLSRDDCDVAVFQRVMRSQVAVMIPVLRSRGIKVVVDVDDDFSALHSHHPARRLLDPKIRPTNNWNVLREACALADLVTTSTPALAKRYAGHGRVAVLPNCVPDWMWELPRESDGRTVGWGGFVAYHPGDLDVTRGGVAAAVSEKRARFVVVGAADGVAKALSLPADPEATGPVKFDQYHRQLGSLDVGIAPLADNAFNSAKSWLKGLEYAAAGVPFVASDVAEYRKLADLGLGVVVGPRAREWRREVRRLLESDLAAESAAIRSAAEPWKMTNHVWRWAEAWANAGRAPGASPRAARATAGAGHPVRRGVADVHPAGAIWR